MEIDRKHVVTQEESGEVAPIDAVEKRVEEEMKQLDDEAKKAVDEGLNPTDHEKA